MANTVLFGVTRVSLSNGTSFRLTALAGARLWQTDRLRRDICCNSR